MKRSFLRREYKRQIGIIMILGIIIGLSWGFCAGILFEQYRESRPKLPVPIVLRGIEF